VGGAMRQIGKIAADVVREFTPQRVKDVALRAWHGRPHIMSREARERFAEHERRASLAQYDARRAVKDLARIDKKTVPDADQQETATLFLEGEASREAAVQSLGEDYVRRLEKWRAEVDANERELLSIGYISPETFAEYEGRYLSRVYAMKEGTRSPVPPPRTGVKKMAPVYMRRDKPIVSWRESGRIRNQKFDSMEEAQAFARQLENTRAIQARREQRRGLRDIRTIRGKQIRQVSPEPEGGKIGSIEVIEPLTKEQRAYLGEVRDPATLTARTLVAQRSILSVHRLLKNIAENPVWASKTPTPDMHPEPVPADAKKYGPLAGKYVHKALKPDILGMLREPADFLDFVAGVSDTLLQQWKWGKTAGNPGTHGRNTLSNAYFAYMEGNSPFNPANLPNYVEGVRLLFGRDVNVRRFLIQEGLSGTDYISVELGQLAQEVLKYRGGSFGEKVKNIIADKAKGFLKGRVFTSLPGADLASRLYMLEDVLPKVSTWVKKVRDGMSPTQAAAEVRTGFPQYDTAITSRFLRRKTPGAALARQTVPPFLTFTAEAARIISRNIVKRPVRSAVLFLALETARSTLASLAGYDDDDIEKMARSAPEYRRPGMFNWIMPWRDDNGKPVVFDLTYTFPLGEQIQSGKAWITGDEMPEERHGAMSLPIGPFLATAIQVATNRSWFTGREINRSRGTGEFIAVSEAQGERDTWAFVGEAMLPSLFPGGYNWNKISEAMNEVPIDLEGKVTRPKFLTLLDTMAGIKMRSFDPDRDAAMRLKRLDDLIGKKLARVRSLARQPENYRGMSERDRQREYDELRGDVVRLWNETLRVRGMSALPDNEASLRRIIEEFDENLTPEERKSRSWGRRLGLSPSEQERYGAGSSGGSKRVERQRPLRLREERERPLKIR